MSAPPIQGADGSSLSHDDFAHLTAFEWNALSRLADISGVTTVAAMLSAASPVQQRNAVQDFVTHELAELTRRSSTPSASTKIDVVKLDVSSYSGEGAKRLALNRWLCEVDIAVQARQLSTEFARTHFLLSKLSGKAKKGALGKLVANPGCFPDMASLKDDLRLAFEPQQDENHHRSAFLALKQGRSSMLDYIQRARHLSSCIVTNPIDMVTQVHVFVSGMNAGHQRFYLTRKPPESLEDAFAVALREDFSVMASQVHQHSFHRAVSEPEPMEIDAIVRTAPPRHGASAGQSRPASSKQLVCFRCRKIGHRAAECRAPAPVLAAVESDDVVVRSSQPKNDDIQ